MPQNVPTLSVFATAKRVHATVRRNDRRVKASTSHLTDRLAHHGFHQGGIVAIPFRTVAQPTKLACIENNKKCESGWTIMPLQMTTHSHVPSPQVNNS